MAEDSKTSENEASTAPENVATSTTQHSEDQGTFVPLIFGGAFACALGFFGGQIDSIERLLGLGGSVDTAALEQRVGDQSEKIARQAKLIEDLTAKLEGVAAAEPEIDLSEVTGQLTDQASALSTQSETLTAQGDALASLADRVEQVEKRPMTEGLSEEAVAAYQAELSRLQGAVADQQTELQSVIDAQRAEIEQLLEDARNSENSAEAKAQAALARAAMSKIIIAVESGEPFAGALSELTNARAVDVPEALSANADKGVPTLSSLQADFPGAARAALATARAAETGGGFGAFLERQLGARSVTPQEGDDPDAVLSRAEAALQQGRLEEVLAEADKLPSDAKDSMADWLSMAQTRHSASVAADELMSALAAN